MKKTLLSLVLFSLLMMMPMGVAMAQLEDSPETLPTSNISSFQDVLDLVDGFVDWLYAFLLVAAAFYLVWGALDYVLGGGDEEKIKSGRNKIKYALIGVAIAVVSKGLLDIVAGLLGVTLE